VVAGSRVWRYLCLPKQDYLLRVAVPDIAAYDAVYKKLTSDLEIFEVSSSFAMEEIKHTTALPLSYIDPE
jgi:Lrp/AsnC family transcriptional regulator